MGNVPLLSCKDTESPPVGADGSNVCGFPAGVWGLCCWGSSQDGGGAFTSSSSEGHHGFLDRAPTCARGLSDPSCPRAKRVRDGRWSGVAPFDPRRSTPGWGRAAAQHAQRSPAHGGSRKADVGEQLSSVVPLLRTLSRLAERLHENR